MKILKLSEWELEVDEIQTQIAYATIEKGGCEICGCSSCKNFLLVAQSFFPTELIDFMGMCNIPINKDTEVFTFETHKENQVLYAGEYYFFGKIIKTPLSGFGTVKETKIMLTEPSSLAQTEFRAPGSIRLHFEIYLPWEITDPIPGSFS